MEVTERYDFARLREVKVSVTISMGVLVSRLGVCFKRMKKNAFHKLDMARYVCFVIFEVEANICTLCSQGKSMVQTSDRGSSLSWV